MQIVVLAGGLTTLETEQLPQSLLRVAGRPLVDWQLDRFAASGAKSVVLCVSYLGEQIETHVRRALDRGLAVSYSYDGEQPVGTGGALRRAFARLESELVVTYGDRYLPFDCAAPLRDLRAHPEALGSMSVYKNPGTLGRSNVRVDGDWIATYASDVEGLDCIDCGAIALRRSVLDEIADGAVWSLEALWSKLSRKRQLRAFMAPERPHEVGTPGGRHDLEQHLQRMR